MGQGQQIRITDWQRMLFGQSPPTVVIEVFIRAVVLLIALLVVVRLLGKRMNGQLTITEMAVLLTLGAIAGNGMELPQRGLLQAIFVFICAYAFQRGLTWLEVKSPLLERVTEGAASMLVKNGLVELRELTRARISHDQLFAVLRSRNIFNLARARRVYLEGCGTFSVFAEADDKPGLSLLPPGDVTLGRRQRRAPGGLKACGCCGFTQSMVQPQSCPNCGRANWEEAVI